MTRGLGTALALSVLAHGGAVATVGVLGAAWLAGSRPTPPPVALFVDLVQPVVATSDRIAPGDASAPRLRSVRAARSESPGVAVPMPRAQSDVVQSPDVAPVTTVDPTSESDRGASVTPDVPPPLAAPVPPAPGGARPESPPAGAAGVHAPPVVPPASPTLAPAPSAAPVAREIPASDTGTSPRWALVPGPVAAAILSDPVGTRSSPTAAATAPRWSPGPEPNSSRAGRESAIPFDVRPTGEEVDTVGSRPPDQSGASGVARLVPGEAQPSGAPEGAIPPEYESYVRALRQRIQDRLVYPWMAVRRGQQGVVELEVRLGPEGRLVGVEVVAGPTAEALRRAAVAAVRGSAPFPFPPGVEGRPLVIRLPVEFRLR